MKLNATNVIVIFRSILKVKAAAVDCCEQQNTFLSGYCMFGNMNLRENKKIIIQKSDIPFCAEIHFGWLTVWPFGC